MNPTKVKHLITALVWLLILAGSIYTFQLFEKGENPFNSLIPIQGNLQELQRHVITEDITDLQVDWVSGGVRIVRSESDEIIWVENGYSEINESRWATATIKNGKLSIVSENQSSFNFMFLFRSRETYLELHLPDKQFDSMFLQLTSGIIDIRDLSVKQQLRVTMTSGRLQLFDSSAQDLNLNMTSGDVLILDSEFENANLTMVSGKMDLNSNINKQLKSRITSGRMNIVFNQVNPTEIDLDATSGSIRLDLHQDANFTLRVNKTSGRLTTNFDGYDGSNYVIGTGANQYYIKMTSGEIRVYIQP